MTADTYGYCGTNHTRGSGCTLYLSVTAYETSEYELVVMDIASPDGTACADGCAWKQLGDGDCQPQCNNTACYHDRGDCDRGHYVEEEADDSALHCRADCKAEWRDDGFCDSACFNAKCAWDGADCGGPGCADDCLTSLRNNGECNAACNVEACDWDGPGASQHHLDATLCIDGHRRGAALALAAAGHH